jgi:hypothetical protein
MTHVVALATDANPPANGRQPASGVRERVRRARAALTATTRSTPFVKEVTRSLADAGFLRAVAIKGEYGSYEVFQATPRGVAVADAAFEVFASDLTDRVETSDGATSDVVEKNADSKKAEVSEVSRREAALKALAARLPNLNARVILPVPESLARAEAERKASAAAKVRELEDAGADTTNIPAAELEAGSGPALNAELQWSRAIAKLRASGDDAKLARADAMSELLRRVENWRDATAEKLGMAPGSVFASFVAKRVAYTCASGCNLDVESLRAAGVRVAGAEGLAAALKSAATELGLARETVGVAGPGGPDARASARMRLAVFTPSQPWAFALYKPKKKKGCPDEPPPWETSWRRFAKGEACRGHRADAAERPRRAGFDRRRSFARGACARASGGFRTLGRMRRVKRFPDRARVAFNRRRGFKDYAGSGGRPGFVLAEGAFARRRAFGRGGGRHGPRAEIGLAAIYRGFVVREDKSVRRAPARGNRARLARRVFDRAGQRREARQDDVK